MGRLAEPTGIKYVLLLLETIGQIRNDYHSCTMREVARQLRKTPMMIQRQLIQLQALGLVDWTTLDGSVHITIKGQNVRRRISNGSLTEMDQLKAKAEPTPELQVADLGTAL